MGRRLRSSQTPRGHEQSFSMCLLTTMGSWGTEGPLCGSEGQEPCQTPVHHSGMRPGGLEGNWSAEVGGGKDQVGSVGRAHNEHFPSLTHSYSHVDICTPEQAIVSVNKGRVISGQSFLQTRALHQGAGEWAVECAWLSMENDFLFPTVRAYGRDSYTGLLPSPPRTLSVAVKPVKGPPGEGPGLAWQGTLCRQSFHCSSTSGRGQA